MEETKKKTVRRKRPMKAGASPIPTGPGSVCGHEGGSCDSRGCHVRYVGPVSHIRDHHAFHAARGATHIWAAAVITGLSLVITGALAYNVVDAKQSAKDAALAKQNANRADIERVMNKLNEIETIVKQNKLILQSQFPSPTLEDVMQNTMPDPLKNTDDATE